MSYRENEFYRGRTKITIKLMSFIIDVFKSEF